MDRRKGNALTFPDFVDVLLDEENVARKTVGWLRKDQMDLPLSDYYIASSHNTYLAEVSQVLARCLEFVSHRDGFCN